MSPVSLSWVAVQSRLSDRQRAAATNGGQAQRSSPRSEDIDTVILRRNRRHDLDGLARLAAVDSSPPPIPPVLLAEVNGELRAAISLCDGSIVADPFRPSRDVVDLLRARAVQVHPAPAPRRRRGLGRYWRSR